VIIAVLAAIAAGSSFSIGAVLQQSAARSVPEDKALSWRLLATLVRRPIWLLGIASDFVSFGLQALALAFGPLALVQPLLVTGLLFALPVAVRLRKRRLGLREWIGTLAVAGGLAMFLAAASPSAGTDQPTTAKWIGIIIAIGALMIVATAIGRATSGTLRPSMYAVAAGASFGLLAALTKTSTSLLSHGAVTFFTSWQPYSMAVVAALGAIVQQSAFQAGPLPVSLPVMDSMEPTVATLLGVVAFGEAISLSVGALVVESIGVVALLGGIVSLDRSHLIHELQDHNSEDADPSVTRGVAAGATATNEA
jgi:drug/metabolite transporter (DMT)-like permease